MVPSWAAKAAPVRPAMMIPVIMAPISRTMLLYEEKEVHGSEADFHKFEEGKRYLSQKIECLCEGRDSADSALANAFEKWHRDELSAHSLFFRNRFGELHQPAKSLRQFPRSTGMPISRQSSDALVRNQTTLLSQPASSRVSNRTNLA